MGGYKPKDSSLENRTRARPNRLMRRRRRLRLGLVVSIKKILPVGTAGGLSKPPLRDPPIDVRQ